MAQSFKHPNAESASLRSVAEGYARLLGPGGLAAYVAHQDLLLLTDIYSALVLCPASKYLKMHRLGRISSFSHRRGEFPGAHSVVPEVLEEAEDMNLKSFISERSIYVAELLALATTQAGVALRYRRELRQTKTADGVHLVAANIDINVGDTYVESLLKQRGIRAYSGVVDNFQEPTESWKKMAVSDKGVYFIADHTFYGLIMPRTLTSHKIAETQNA